MVENIDEVQIISNGKTKLVVSSGIK